MRSGASSSRRCSPASRGAAVAAAVLLASALGAALFAGEGGSSSAVYVVITRDGHRLDVMEKPAAGGDRVRLRLAPAGTLATISADAIDWAATEEFNLPPPPPKPAAPSAVRVAESAPSRGPGQPIEMKIIGIRRSVTAAAPPRAEGGMDPAQAADLMAVLRREMGYLKSLHERLLQSRLETEREIAGLQERQVNAAPVSSVENYQQPSQRAMDQARARLQSVNDQIQTLERRMNEIRAQAIMAGSALD